MSLIGHSALDDIHSQLNNLSSSGRTGRFGRQGIAVNFVSDENSWQAIQDLKNDLGRDIVKVATGDFDEMEKVSVVLEEPGVDPVTKCRHLLQPFQTLKFHMKK